MQSTCGASPGVRYILPFAASPPAALHLSSPSSSGPSISTVRASGTVQNSCGALQGAKNLAALRDHAAGTVSVLTDRLWSEHLCGVCFRLDAKHLQCVARCDILPFATSTPPALNQALPVTAASTDVQKVENELKYKLTIPNITSTIPKNKLTLPNISLNQHFQIFPTIPTYHLTNSQPRTNRPKVLPRTYRPNAYCLGSRL